MARCKWCDSVQQTDAGGFCDLCRETIRADIKKQKSFLDDALSRSMQNLSDAERQLLLENVSSACAALQAYKDKRIPFYKSDYRPVQRSIYQNLGVSPPAPPSRVKTSITPVEAWHRTASYFLLPGVVAVCFFLVISNSDYSRMLINRDDIIAAQNSQITVLTEKIEEMKREAESSSDESVEKQKIVFTLRSGNYIAGENFPAGTYNLWAVKGGGNVSSDNAYSGGLNAIMGTDTKDGFYQRSYNNILLPAGTTLSIDGVDIRLTMVNED